MKEQFKKKDKVRLKENPILEVQAVWRRNKEEIFYCVRSKESGELWIEEKYLEKAKNE